MVISARKLIYFQIYYLMIVETLISLFHLPGVIRYILDVNMLLIILLSIRRGFAPASFDIDRRIKRYSIILMVGLVVIAVFRFVPIGQLLWAVRNNFFYIIFFIICINELTSDDVDQLMNRVMKLQILNVICGLYEYFVLNVQNDFLGGMFGTDQGCNAYLNVYLVVITTYAMTKYMEKEINLRYFIWILLSSVAMATLGELKIFYFEVVVIILFSILLNRKSIKSVAIIGFGIIGIYAGLQILAVTSSESVEILNSLDNIFSYGSTSESLIGDVSINRTTAISTIYKLFFKNDMIGNLFGYGLGACEDSQTFAWCNSAFADKYSYLQYRNMSTSMLYVEIGLVGLAAVIVLFIYLFYLLQKNRGLFDENKVLSISTFSQIMCIMTIIGIWYNSALRRECAYLTFFALAAAVIYYKSIKENIYDIQEN